MKRGLLLLLGILLIVILSYFCFMGKAQKINEDLVTKSNAVYEDKQMGWVDVAVKGQELEMTRTLVLSGVAPSAKKREEAEVMARNVNGVLEVDNQLIVKEVATVAPAISVPYKIAVTKDKLNKVTLEGDVPNIEVHNELIAKAQTLFGNENVIDKLTELKGKPIAWEESISLGLERLENVDYGHFNIEDNDFNFEGYVSKAENKTKVITNLKENLNKHYAGTYNIKVPKVEVEEVATVVQPIAPPSPYTISVIKNQVNRITLSGYVANANIHKELVTHADTLFGKENVIDELKEVEGSPKAWKESSILGLDKLKILDYGEFNISDMNYNFKGYIGSQDEKELMLKNLSINLNSAYSGTYDITAPIVKSFSCQEHFKSLLAKEKIHFEYDRAEIKSSSYGVLNKLVEIAQECPNAQIEIEGHTDSDGSKKYNQQLSFRRATAVKKYLIGKGIQENTLTAIGYGELKPIATNKTSKGKEQNRRIEFNVKGMK